MKPTLVILTGAGISAESGIQTFRDSNGLWENHDIMEVASIDGWRKNPRLVLDFYNKRRAQLLTCKPNTAHIILKNLEKKYNVKIITQNVDDLHERAGSSSVLHLHGQLLQARSTREPSLVYTWHKDINLGDKCDLGSQLRPNIVWFGENVPNMEPAIELASRADIFCVIGTSLQVYPAASLLRYAPKHTNIYIIDISIPTHVRNGSIKAIEAKASEGCKILFNELMP